MKKIVVFALPALVIILFALAMLYPSESGTTKNDRLIVDMAGNTVHIPAQVNRVVTAIYPIATQLIFLVGAQETLVGISAMDVNPVMSRIYPPIDRIYRPGKSSNGDISAEEIIKMRPDVVFTHMRNSRGSNFHDTGIATVCLKLETPEALMEGIVLVGEIMNRQERAAEVVDFYRRHLDAIEETTSTLPEKKRVYFAGPDMLSTAGGDYYQNFVIEYAGGTNVAHQARGGWCSISVEHLLAWNPDCIFIGNYGTARVESFTKDPRLAGLRAVLSGNVYMSPYFIGSWDVPTPESLLGIMWLASKLYPKEVRFDMAQEMVSFYSTCYGYTPDRHEITQVLGK